jgi:hypothetical protein
MPTVTGNFTVNNGDTANAAYLNLLCQSVVTVAGAQSLLGNPTASTSQVWSEITIGSSLSFSGSVLNTVQALSATSSPTFSALTLTNNLVAGTGITAGTSIAATTSVSGATGAFTGLLTRLHDAGNSGTPTFTAGPGAGTGPTILIGGNDMSGSIQLSTGTGPSGSNALIVTITFATVYGAAPTGVVLFPGNAATAALTSAQVPFVATPGTSHFNIDGGATALAASTTYIWYFRVN